MQHGSRFMLQIALEVYGKDHVRAKRSINILGEPIYARIARQRGDKFPTAEPAPEPAPEQ